MTFCYSPGMINWWKLGGKTPCEHCGRFNHKGEDNKIAKNWLQKGVKSTGLPSLKNPVPRGWLARTQWTLKRPVNFFLIFC